MKKTKKILILIILNVMLALSILWMNKGITSPLDIVGLVAQVSLTFLFVLGMAREGASFALLSSAIFAYQMYTLQFPGHWLLFIQALYFTIFNAYQIALTFSKKYMDEFINHNINKIEIIFSALFCIVGLGLYIYFNGVAELDTIVGILALLTFVMGFGGQILETFGAKSQFAYWLVSDFISLIYALLTANGVAIARYATFTIIQIQSVFLVNFKKED